MHICEGGQVRYFAAWTIVIGVAGIFLSALASAASLRRWSVDPWDEGIVGLSLIAFLMSSVLSTLWFASGIIIGGPLTAMAGLLWPDEALRDFDFGFISFLPINGAVGICIHFILFPYRRSARCRATYMKMPVMWLVALPGRRSLPSHVEIARRSKCCSPI